MPENNEIKHRDLCFCDHNPQQQAEDAMLLLQLADGIISINKTASHRLRISYDIRKLSLEIIDSALSEIGFHLDNSLICKLKRALYYYVEDIQRENLGISRENNDCTRCVFVNRYQQLKHGCRDGKTDEWRQYR